MNAAEQKVWRDARPGYSAAKSRAWREKNPDKVKEARAKWASENAERIKEIGRSPEHKAACRKWLLKNPRKGKEYHLKYDHTKEAKAKVMFQRAKTRATRIGVPFNIDLEDIVIPDVCPALGLPLDLAPKGRKWGSDNSPSLDRTIPALGYVKGNVRVISWRANTIKKNATADELRKLATYLEALES